MHLMGLRTSIFVSMIAVGAAGCSVGDDTTTKPTGAGGAASTAATTGTTSSGATGSTSSTGAAGSTASSTAASTTSGPSTSSTTGTGAGGATGTGGSGGGDAPSPLPFVVDSVFIASGYMGDGSVTGAILQDDNMTCLATRPAGAEGHCHKFTYTPPAVGMGWGGVYWQYPVNNWGTNQGKRIAPGATKVTFYAAGAAGGEIVKFIVGGMKGTPYADTLEATLTATLTTTMAPYIVDLTGKTYDAVLGGFGWVIEAPLGIVAPIVFTVDSIRWDQ
jgi:hypothetical protein